MNNRAYMRLSLMIAACAVFTGCSGGPPTEHVSGTITYNGAPVADAQVGFVPDGGDESVKPARGQTDASGAYTLRTYLKPGQEASGAMVGRYKVTVVKGLPQKQVIEYEDLKNKKDQLPPAYADATTTTLDADVTASGANEFNFTLEDAK